MKAMDPKACEGTINNVNLGEEKNRKDTLKRRQRKGVTEIGGDKKRRKG